MTLETDTEIYLDEEPAFVPPRRFVRGSRKWVKHVRCEGARFHVLSWSTGGRSCSEPDCIINKPSDRARRGTP